TIISGKNGVGKTSILESIIWALTGKDTEGGGDPKQFIKLNTDRAEVILESDKFALTRSITSKSSQVVRICLRGWDKYEQISQDDLEKKLGFNFRMFSSIINVGFFMNRSP